MDKCSARKDERLGLTNAKSMQPAALWGGGGGGVAVARRSGELRFVPISTTFAISLKA